VPPSAAAGKEIKIEINDLDSEDEEDEEISKCPTNIEDHIVTLIATGHMFKAHAIAKKSFQK
jgi:hypothetical protein